MNIINGMPWIYWIDDIGHRLHLPKKLQLPLCDRLDKAFVKEAAHQKDEQEWTEIYTAYEWEVTKDDSNESGA